MKLSSAFLLLAGVASRTMAMTVSHKNANKVLRHARKLDQNQQNDDQQAENEYAFLGNYNLKMIKCAPDMTVRNQENGEYEYSAVVVRLCPSESGCDSDSQKGCGAGYGDYIVGLQTFVNAYFEDQRDNMQWDDDTFKVDEYTECREYEMEQGDDDNQAMYYVGPKCTDDGADVAFGVFQDEQCTYASETAFEDISNGWSLPYEDSGLVSTSCIDCMSYNDNGEYELREMCWGLYEDAGSKCETNMEYYSYYGQNTQGCETIAELFPAPEKSSGGKIFGWIVFILIVVGIASYVVWWRKKKQSSADGLMS